LIALLEAATRQWSTADLAAALEQCDVPAGPINTIDQVFEDPHVVARGLRIAPEGLSGVASPIVIDGQRMVSDRASPQRS
jgi:crotonobetainyl-CoA:carnitine CoA-transferase CaiB-like acyl-CoA transferase